MGREIRRVPPGWQHPRRQLPDYRAGRMVEDYQPLHDHDAESAWADWQAEYARWLAGEFERVRAENPETFEGVGADEPYRAFCEWNGRPPDPERHRPKWDEAAATWYQVYETVSEGTPVTPPFATREELVDYLVRHGDFWDQKRGNGGWTRKNAEAFVNAGFAFSLAVECTAAGVDIREPRDGEPGT